MSTLSGFRLASVLLVLGLCGSSVTAGDSPRLLGIIRADSAHVLFGSDLIPLIDQNGDGTNELVIYNGRFSNYLYRGGDPFDTVPYLRFDSTFSRGGAGDVNGDGWNDLMLYGQSTSRLKTRVYYGGPSLDTVRDFNLGSDSNPPDLFPIVAHDLNADGLDEIVVDRINSDEVHLYDVGMAQDTLVDMILRQHELPPVAAGNFGYQIALGNFNGDSHQDLAVSQITQVSGHNKGRVYFYFGGPGFDTLPDFTIYRRGPYDTLYHSSNNFGEVMTCPGDLNGDGYDDLFVSSGFQDDTGWFYFGGAVLDTVPDLYMTMMPNHAAPAGDINRDGYDDLIVSHATAWSGEGFVLVYYGGPTMDAQWDIGLFVGGDPDYRIYWGNDVVGLGDFNGDGVDDFAFTTYDYETRGLIYIYSGTGQPNGVQDPKRDSNDGSIFLDNYPNPFNLSTSIRFDLPRTGHVQLAIYDLLGRKVVTLEDNVLVAGPHEYQWNGTDASGHPAASGTYLCRLSWGDREVTRKIVLVK